jgi:hypothetical protein
MALCPEVPASCRAGFFLRQPRFHSRISRFNGHPVVVDTLFDTIELAFQDLLRLVEGCRAIRFERSEPTIHPVKFNPQLVAKPTNSLTHSRLLQVPAMILLISTDIDQSHLHRIIDNASSVSPAGSMVLKIAGGAASQIH